MERITLTDEVIVGANRIEVGPDSIHRREVREGYYDPGPPRRLLVTTKENELAVEMKDDATALEALRALGVDVERRAAQFIVADGPNPAGVALLLLVAVLVAFCGIVGGQPLIAVVGIVFGLLVFLRRPTRGTVAIEVGREGVRILGPLLRTIAIEDITDVKATAGPCRRGHWTCIEASVHIATRADELIVPLPHQDSTAPELARVIAERIREAMSIEAPSTSDSTFLDAPIVDVREWRETIVKMVTAREDYRDATLNPSEASRILRDPHAPVQRRLGAAITLHASGVEDARAQIHVCAEATADPHVRYALLRIADGKVVDGLLERATI